MHHVMLDLETFGVRPGCVIRSIGAVEFEIDGKTGDTFYANIEPRSCEVVGLTIDPKTRDWWLQQPGAVQAIFKKDPQTLRAVVRDFYGWFRSKGPADKIRVWAHGAAFDPPIWQAAAEAVGLDGVPWSYWNVRDTRTLYDFTLFDVRDMERDSLPHSALDDCLFQVKCVAAAYQRFELKTPGQTYPPPLDKQVLPNPKKPITDVFA
jgi:hypothetical protein